ncbi:unnamed protein product [Amoebophrya sp. A120]|nr:unnamed protein product [Amoebophrya sp. A120]|eukprot:GSA120T00014338001.1
MNVGRSAWPPTIAKSHNGPYSGRNEGAPGTYPRSCVCGPRPWDVFRAAPVALGRVRWYLLRRRACLCPHCLGAVAVSLWARGRSRPTGGGESIARAHRAPGAPRVFGLAGLRFCLAWL